MSPLSEDPDSSAIDWFRSFTDWVEIYKLIHDLGAAGASSSGTPTEEFVDATLMQKWLSGLIDCRDSIEAVSGENIDPTEVLLGLWKEYSRNLPLALRDLVEMISRARGRKSLNGAQTSSIENYLSAIYEQQMLFLDIARSSLEFVGLTEADTESAESLSDWFDRWTREFESRFTAVASADKYALGFARLVHAGIEARNALLNNATDSQWVNG